MLAMWWGVLSRRAFLASQPEYKHVRMPRHRGTVLLVIVLAIAGIHSAVAQNNRFTERAYVPAPSVRAMGDAGVGLVAADRPFFYNAAQLPNISSHFTVMGVQAAASRDLRDQINFFNQRIQPAIEAEFDLGPDVLDRLYRDAYHLGEAPIRGDGAVVLPAFVYSTNGVGIGGGLFAKTAVNYRVRDAGLGVPEVYLLSRTDVMAIGALGLDLGLVGLDGASVGVTAKRTRRFLAFENKPLDTFTTDEAAILLQGNTFQIDVGALYTVPWALPGRLTLGGAFYDVLDQPYNYAFSGAPRIPFLEGIIAGSAKVDAGTADAEADRARRRFELNSSYRVGVGYRLTTLSFPDHVALAIDYVGYGNDEQNPLARLHMGGEAQLGGGVVLRAGLAAGYPTGGLGLRLGVLQVDYAFHAFEEGRTPGQRATYVHSTRMTIRIR